ncbi:MAG: hypothetical protein RBR24_09395 [Candidatus Carbobacillus sp.]|nr:hypothetical protein [Candidatus Carbobacillus sp.]
MRSIVKGFFTDKWMLILLFFGTVAILLIGCAPDGQKIEPYSIVSGTGERIELFHLPFGDGPNAVGFLPFRDEWGDQGPMSFEVFGKEVFILDTANRRIVVQPLPERLFETQPTSVSMSSSHQEHTLEANDAAKNKGQVIKTIDLPDACWLKDSTVATINGHDFMLVYDLCTETVRTIDPETGKMVEQQNMKATDWEAFKEQLSPYPLKRTRYDTVTLEVEHQTIAFQGKQTIERFDVLDMWKHPQQRLVVYKIEQSGSETMLTYKHVVGVISQDGLIEAAYALPMDQDIYTPYSPVRAREGYIYWMSIKKDGLHFYRVVPGAASKEMF